ncbi:MAG: hypothetical protein AAF939_22630 [Planctomycetota bacterium]
MNFSKHIGIDYSGAAKACTPSKTLQIYQTDSSGKVRPVSKETISKSASRNWSRIEIYNWLSEQFSVASTEKRPIIVGIDHGFSFPISYFKRYRLKSWNSMLIDFCRHWPTHQAEATVQQFRNSSKRTGDSKELRLTERWTSSAKSVFQFDVQGSVAKSTHAGLPFLNRIKQKQDVHVWPFDGWKPETGRSVIAEVFPSIFRNRYARDNRTVDQQDAFSIASWLFQTDQDGYLNSRYLNPPLTSDQQNIAELEGWILGVC